jgi:hypothetical protein
MASDFVAPSRTTKVGVISIGVSMSIDTCVRVLYCLCDVCTSVHRVHRIPYSCIYP